MSTNLDLVPSFTSRAAGWQVTITRYTGSAGAVVTVERTFPAGDVAAYRAAENDANELMRWAPVTSSGSTWGTDSASVGGHAGLTGGYMRLSKSGVSVRWASAVAKALGITVTTR